jgi:hypothetical protein
MRAFTILLLGTCLSAAVSAYADQVQPVSFGFEVGLAWQHQMFDRYAGQYVPSHVLLGTAYLQVITRFDGDGPEHFQLVNELTLAQSIRPGSRFIMGLSEVGRYTFGRQRPARFFVDAGAGICSYGLRIRETTGWMQYQLQFGAGIKYRLPESDTTWIVGYRGIHYSDHNTSNPNIGLNLHSLYVGANF